MPIPEAPLRVFRTFICIKRIPLPPSLFYCVPLSSPLPFSLASCSLPSRRLLPSTSAIWKHFHFLFSPPFYLGSARVLSLFRFYTSFCPSSLYLSTLPHVLFRHIPLIYPLCFSEELECFLYARISLLNLVHQVTILLLTPFSPRYFSCRYSTLLLFLVNAFVFVTRRTSSGTSPLFFCIR